MIMLAIALGVVGLACTGTLAIVYVIARAMVRDGEPINTKRLRRACNTLSFVGTGSLVMAGALALAAATR